MISMQALNPDFRSGERVLARTLTEELNERQPRSRQKYCS
ncbi:hypothetical protein D030_4914 [Vibrio parahaemolyticus AQ3810]|nr:hypothetical protein D030_4914 [Vibrio parahaemolyticus AQ3810]